MTYSERIEAIKAEQSRILTMAARDLLLHDVSPTLIGALALCLARAADIACLKAIEEPTREMLWPEVTKLITRSDAIQPGSATYEGAATSLIEIWKGLHAAIPRGE